jgi:TonB family protein
VSAVAAPRLAGGVAASVLLHGGLIAAFLLLRSPASPPPPQMIQVHMIAAPAGERAIGAVQAPTVPAVEAPRPKPVVAPERPKPTVAAAKAKLAPKAETPTPKTKIEQPKTPPAAAGGGPTGGQGTQVANIDTPGITFDYPGYTNNIVSALLTRFGAMNGSLEAEVRFVIKRDGSVDPSSIRIVTSSGNYSFDQRALSAVESAGNARAFGPLPTNFREDILPVTFRFSPRVIR